VTEPGLSRSAVHRITCTVTAAEVRRLRDTASSWRAPDELSDDMLSGDEGLGLDSLEQLGVLGALAETFGLDDTGLGEQTPQKVGDWIDWIDWIMVRHDAGDRTITVRTSGSTGAARPCGHTLDALLDETAYLANHFSNRKHVIAMVPANHLYGVIWTALLPSALGVPVLARTLGTALDLVAGDLIVAVPDQWQAISRMTRRFPDDIIGVSSAGMLDGIAATDLLMARLIQLIDVYGSSETGAIALRSVPDTMYELLPWWNLVPQGDHDCHLRDRRGIQTEMPDLIERAGERLLRPVGRRDGAVKVAGLNVWPNYVAQVLRDADGVADVAVRLHANGRLKAFIVPEAGREINDLASHLDRFVAQKLRS
jgi:4-coumarate--CoA ligase (photoactive yellow protein activation family)